MSLRLPSSPLPYRRDIDGLRAIAVLAVVLYHFGVPGIPGGFVGVDIFFVLSGFLIGGILWQEQQASGRLSLRHFYMRRIRRLAPAYVAMAAVTSIAAWSLLLPFEFREFGKQLIAATIYLSNVLFWRQAGYFDAASEEKPLLHTWSLSVEEQFYILLPVLLIALFQLDPRARLPGLWAGFAASFAACIWITQSDAVSAFFLIHLRAWELLAGVLLAVHLARGWQPPARLALPASVAGLALVLYALARIQAGPDFPGWQAVLPVAGTVLLLIGGLHAHPLTRVLSLSLPVRIGLLSYSLYLWHWPVFVLSRYARGAYAGPVEIAGWIALSVALAWLSWRFVETPLRRGRSQPSRVFAAAALASIAILLFGGWLYRSDGLPQRFGPEVRPHISASADFLQDFSRCTSPASGPLAGIEICPIGPDGPPSLLVWGDSHLRAFKEGIDQAAWEADRPGLLIWRAGCPPLFGIEKRESYATPAEDAACTAANARIEAALPQLGLDDIVLVGRWSYYATGTGVGRDAENRIFIAEDQSSAVAAAVTRTVSALNALGLDVWALRQPPEIPDYDSRETARMLAHGRLSPSDAQAIMQVARPQAEARAAPGEAPFRALIDQGALRWLDPWPRICDGTTCHALPDGAPFYFDNNHVTNHAARALRGIFGPAVATP